MISQHQPVNPFLTLAVSFISQVCAGTHYWYPAIAPGIAAALRLTEWQSTIVIAVANTGAILGIVGGLLHQRLGSRLTTSFSALGISFSYFMLALITMVYNGTEAPAFVFYLVLVVTVCITTASFPLYSCSIATTASIFPPRYRGRLVGLNVMTYGGSSGVLTAIQSVLFPTIADATANLYFIAVYSFVVAVATFLVYPSASKYDVERITVPEDEMLPLRQETGNADPEGDETDLPPAYDKYISCRLGYAYRIALSLVVALQLNAICGIVNAPFQFQVVATILVVSSLGAMLSLPASSSMRVYPMAENEAPTPEQQISDVESSPDTTAVPMTVETPSIWTIMTDARGMYMEAAFVVLVGGSGLFLLVQSLYLVDSLQYGPNAVWADVDSHLVVRTIVALFGACSVTGRLIMGGTIDRGSTAEKRIMYGFKLLQYNMLLMMGALLAVAIPSKFFMLCAIVLIGLSYGAFFCIAPTLITLWFGVATFPRNYAVYAAFAVFATVSVNSSVAAWIRERTGHWINVGGADAPKMVCGGMMCFLPTVVPSAVLLLMLFMGGRILEPIVHRRARMGKDGGTCFKDVGVKTVGGQ